MILRIPGEPVAKSRPKFYKGHATTPEKTVNYETLVKQLWAINEQPRLNGPLKATVTAYFTIPKSVSQKKRNMMANGAIRPEKKPDADNIAKIILDALNTLAYDDDKQIVSLTVEKFYSESPRVLVEVNELKGGEGGK